MKIAIIQFPGSNCETESIRAVKAAGMEPFEFLWNHDERKLEDADGYFIVGGFSYEDRSRSGIIASLDPVMEVIARESGKGKPVLGICNGAQILVETGLVPGLRDNVAGMALAVNKRMKNGKILGTGFYNGWVNAQLSAPSEASAFTRHIQTGEFMRLPVAHGEGRFIIPDSLLDEMRANHLTTFRYCDDAGNNTAEFPANPNGSVFNLAAVCNARGNVMAMMPHPERTPNGQPIFRSMRDYIAEPIRVSPQNTLAFSPRRHALADYEKPTDTAELIVQLIITDNEAATVQSALSTIGIHARLKRYTHWEITARDTLRPTQGKLYHISQDILVESGELFNANKERVVSPETVANDPNSVALLVRYRDEFIGQSKCDVLKSQLRDGIEDVKKGTLWHISIERGNIETLLQHILDSRILFNQYSQTCHMYK